MEKEQKIRIIKESFYTLRARKIVKTQNEFAEYLNISAKSLSAAKNGDERYLTDNLIEKIQTLMNEQERPAMGEQIEHITIHNASLPLVPTIPYKAYKEVGLDIQNYLHNRTPDLYMSPAVAQFATTDCHYFVGSDAMLPHLHQSDVLALKRMPEEAQVINGEIYVVNSKYNGLIARFVYDDGDHIILKASDAQTRFTPMRLPKSEVYGLYRVLGLVRTNI